MKPGFWDDLVPLKGGLFGAQLAGWTPGPPARSGLGCLWHRAPGGSWAGQRPSVPEYVVMTTGPGRGDHRQMLLMSASLSGFTPKDVDVAQIYDGFSASVIYG
ncbi:MAG TPA: hypothetical protein VLV16_11400, partial [Gemmatimonadales bacterium]|nr:hypothetical protein [Gemmatimonadales bacterium]